MNQQENNIEHVRTDLECLERKFEEISSQIERLKGALTVLILLANIFLAPFFKLLLDWIFKF